MLRRVLTLTCVGILMLAVACSSGSPTAAQTPSRTPEVTPTATPTSPSPTRSPKPSRPKDWESNRLHLVVKVGHSSWPAVIIQAGNLLYASYHVTGNHAGQGIMRLNPVAGTLHRGPAIPGWKPSEDALAFADDSLWIPIGTRGTGGSANSLARVSLDTLRVTQSIPLDAKPTAVATTPAGLWVAAGRHLLLIDVARGAVARTLTVPGSIKILASDPAGQRLYISTTREAGDRSNLLAEYDASTGALIAQGSAGVHEFNGPSNLVATDRGVWATVPGGMMASLAFYRSGALHPLPMAEGQAGGSNRMSAYLAGGKLWISDVQRLACLSPATGRELGHIKVNNAGGPVVGDRWVYVWTRDGLAIINPLPAPCA